MGRLWISQNVRRLSSHLHTDQEGHQKFQGTRYYSYAIGASPSYTSRMCTTADICCSIGS